MTHLTENELIALADTLKSAAEHPHLNECDACRADFEAHRRLDDQLQTTLAPMETIDIRKSVMASIGAPEKSGLDWVIVAAIVGGLLTLTVTFSVLLPGSEWLRGLQVNLQSLPIDLPDISSGLKYGGLIVIYGLLDQIRRRWLRPV